MPPEDVFIPTPTVGEIVSFSYESNARRELPQSPKIFSVRTDLEWDDVVRNFYTEQRLLNGKWCIRERAKTNVYFKVESSRGFTAQPMGYWTAKNMRLFLERFAKDRHMDPLLAETWYNLSSSLIREEEVRKK